MSFKWCPPKKIFLPKSIKKKTAKLRWFWLFNITDTTFWDIYVFDVSESEQNVQTDHSWKSISMLLTSIWNITETWLPLVSENFNHIMEIQYIFILDYTDCTDNSMNVTRILYIF